MKRALPTFVLIVAASLLFASSVQSQVSLAVSPERELVVGTKEAPPFVIKGADGAWQGISIELWQRVAKEMNLRYRIFEEATVQDLLDGVAAGKFDVAVGALTVTSAREQSVDFTQPFYAAGAGIAVTAGGVATWLPIVRAMTSFGFVQAVLALVGFAVVVGFLVWLFERRRNEEFGGGVRGLSSGIFWSTSAMTQRHTGGLAPRTLPGRIIAVFWMVASIIAIAVFTAGITSALTMKQLRGSVHGVGDLSVVRVGAVSGTATEEALARLRVPHQGFGSLREGIDALRADKIDAFAHDRPILAWVVRDKYSSSIELIDATFEPQNYALALPPGSPLRKRINVVMLDALHTDWWEQTLFRYLGTK